MARNRNESLTFSVADENGFTAAIDVPLTLTDLPVLSDRQLETVNRNWSRIGSLVDVIANRFAIDRGIRPENSILIAFAEQRAVGDCNAARKSRKAETRAERQRTCLNCGTVSNAAMPMPPPMQSAPIAERDLPRAMFHARWVSNLAPLAANG